MRYTAQHPSARRATGAGFARQRPRIPAASVPRFPGHEQFRAQSRGLFQPISLGARLGGGDGAGDAKIEKVKTYRLEPGRAGVYDVGAIHAIDYPEGSRFVRVTGRDLDHVRRLKFDTAAGKAITIESATAGAAG